MADDHIEHDPQWILQICNDRHALGFCNACAIIAVYHEVSTSRLLIMTVFLFSYCNTIFYVSMNVTIEVQFWVPKQHRKL